MKANQAWAWLAAGVLALGLNGIYQDDGAVWAHRIMARGMDAMIARVAERKDLVLASATGRSDWFAASLNQLSKVQEFASCRIATGLLRLENSLLPASMDRGFTGMDRLENDRFQAMSAREEAALAQFEANRSRVESQIARVQIKAAALDPLSCPRMRTQMRGRMRMNVPRVRIFSSPISFVN